MRKGSITIFATLSMVLVLAVLFALLEGMRFQEIRRISQSQTELSLESFFAKYKTDLWKKYHLLGSDDTTMLELLKESASARENATEYGLNLFQTQVRDIQINSTTRITDGDGAAFIYAVSSYMETQVLYETLKSIYNQYEAIRSLIQSGEINRSSIEEALENIQSIQSQMQAQNGSDSTTIESETEDANRKPAPQIENPLETIKNLQKMGVLELLISDTSTLSERLLQENGLVSNRELQKGKNASIPEIDWLDKVLFQQYLLSYFSNYCDTKENTSLSYELEYILYGKSQGIENLKLVAQQLIGIREVLNFLYLMSNVKAQEEAGLLAIALVGASVNPVIIETIKIGILTAWAFGESILDVRALLHGKKVPLIKSNDTWTLALADLGAIAQTNLMSKESAVGISYSDYLGILIFFQNENSLAMHAMDLQESGFQMDKLCIQADVTITYTYHAIFDFFQLIPMTFLENREIFTNAEFSYY